MRLSLNKKGGDGWPGMAETLLYTLTIPPLPPSVRYYFAGPPPLAAMPESDVARRHRGKMVAQNRSPGLINIFGRRPGFPGLSIIARLPTSHAHHVS